METNASNLTLSIAQLVTLLQALREEPGALSPLQAVGAAGSTASPVGLPDAVSRHAEEWQAIARTLLKPKVALVTSTAIHDQVVYLHAFASPATGDRLVGCTRGRGDEYEIVPSLATSAWGQVLWDGLALDNVTRAAQASATMSAEALMACCGLVDAIKESRLEALIARTPYPAAHASTASIALAIKSCRMASDARWFTGLVRRLLPEDPAGGEVDATRQGLLELAQLGWVLQVGDDEWGFAETMEEVATEWSSAAVSGLFSLHEDEAGGLSRFHLGLIRTLSGLWVIECLPNDRMLRVGTGTGKALMLTLMKAVKALLASCSASPPPAVARPPALSVSQPSRHCPSCGTGLMDGARFCAGCGKPVQAPEVKPSCPGCGKPVLAGHKFCGGCGHRLV
jgi:Double zinc ribbon